MCRTFATVHVAVIRPLQHQGQKSDHFPGGECRIVASSTAAARVLHAFDGPRYCAGAQKTGLHPQLVGTVIAQPAWQMEERTPHPVMVIVGASESAEQLRRLLVRQNLPHVGVTSHLRGLRRMLALGSSEHIVLCIVLDRPTLARYGAELKQLLADRHGFAFRVGSVGLLPEPALAQRVASLGCDLYVQNPEQAAAAIALLSQTTAAPVTPGQFSDTDCESRLSELRRNGRLWDDSSEHMQAQTLVASAATAIQTNRIADHATLLPGDDRLDDEVAGMKTQDPKPATGSG